MYQVFEVATGAIVGVVRSVQAAQNRADFLTEESAWTGKKREFDYQAMVA